MPMMPDPSASAAALIPIFVLLSILTAGATQGDSLHHVFSGPRSPLPTVVFAFNVTENSGVFRDASATFHRRRSLLTYRILAENGSSSPSPAVPNAVSTEAAPRRNRRYKRKIRNWLIGFFIGSIAGVSTGLVISALFRLALNCIRGRYRNLGGAEIFSHAVKNKYELAFLEKDDGLADLDVIGRGACGEVYRKELATSAGVKMIAIKQIHTGSASDGAAEPMTAQDSRLLDKWMRQIRSEIRTVGRIRHRNLLPLIAHVSYPDRHYLIYEYMKNGSLHDMLRDTSEGRREFGWPARLRIAIGIAAGLEHLHVHHKPHIVHRDLKPANVLIDDDMEARISDFGLAKELPDTNTHMTTLNVAGTIGYIAPEYYQTMKYTTKCDVYSFGVILAVMVMGRFPSDSFFQETEELTLVKWMRKQLWTGNTAACFDGQLSGRGVDAQLELALRVACFCSADNPNERPSSKEVRLMLGQISSG